MDSNEQQCTLIKRLSQVGAPGYRSTPTVSERHGPGIPCAWPDASCCVQDMWEVAWNATRSRTVYPSCDSSDCLVCQGQRTFCSQTVTDQVCSWLERRLSAPVVASDAGSACQPAEEGVLEPQRQKRLKRVASDMSQDSDSVARACSALSTVDESYQTHWFEGRTWAWRDDWADRDSPAPCQMVEVASLQSAAESCGGSGANRRHDMICGLEFSPDGQLLAAAGVSKQVWLSS